MDWWVIAAVAVALLGALAFFASRSSAAPTPKKPTSAPVPAKVFHTRQEEVDAGGITYYSAEEIAKHNKVDDCWIIVDGMVYDVTPYVDKHMGGEDAITRYAGQDNTKPFHGDQHPLKVREVIDEFYIGRLAK